MTKIRKIVYTGEDTGLLMGLSQICFSTENTEYDWFGNATYRNKKSGHAIETVKLFGTEEFNEIIQSKIR